MSMRLCGHCHCYARQDDPMQVAQWLNDEGDTVTAAVCHTCEYLLRGQEAPPPQLYPPGRNYPFGVCGVCRLALPDDEAEPKPMRLAAADVAGLGIKPGCYAACRVCVAQFAPVIRARLVANPEQAGLRHDQANHIPPLASFTGDWLLAFVLCLVLVC